MSEVVEEAASNASNVEPIASTSTDNGQSQLSPEFLQRKLYFLLENLKKMHSELPE